MSNNKSVINRIPNNITCNVPSRIDNLTLAMTRTLNQSKKQDIILDKQLTRAKMGTRKVRCPDCDHGYKYYMGKFVPCDQCAGTGRDKTEELWAVPCGKCNGTGKMEVCRERCERCGATGYIWE